MRLNINLATRPYEDVRQFLARWGTLTLLLVVLSFGLLYVAVSNWRASSDINQQISRLQDEMDKLDKARAKAVETLNQPENKAVADQSRFINAAIQQKSLSWTRIFMDLERMMPPRLHVVSITPAMTRDNQLAIQLLVAGDSRDQAVELVRRMEDSTTFRRAQLHSELATQNPTNPADTIQFGITANYVPAGESKPAGKSAPSPSTAKAGGAR